MAGQTFTLNFDAKLNVAQMKGAIGNIQSELNRLQLPQNLTKGITGTLTSLEKELRNFEVAAGKDLGQKNNFSAFERSAERISSLFKDLQIQARDLGQGISLDKFFPQDVVQTINQARTALKNYESEVDKLNRKVSGQKGQVTKALANQTVAKDNLDTAKEQLNTFAQQYEQTLTDLFNRVKIDPKNIIDQASIDQAIAEAQKRIERLQQIQNNVNAKGQPYKYADSTKEKAKAEEAALTGLITKYNELREAQAQQSTAIQKLQTAYDTATNKVKAAQVALQEFENAAKAGTTDALNKLITELNKLGIDTTGVTNIEQAKAALAEFSKTAEGEAAAALEKLRSELERQRPTFDNNADAVRQSADAYRQFNDSLRDVSSVKSRIQYFFGLNNAINLIKRGIREAISTVKELDKAMTETAVVTSNTISDMWQKLPDYTKRANELGVSTLEAYQAATLYYQQGLNDDQAAALSVETLKMARIAGLEAADATDRMTNALRGFNMELNAVSAQKVDDVYSQLAAMSASNVDEISTAMTKVASLAHSANMEFETTAAFLAQIIETTRESAETAGTALKTVVARFSEVKKLYDMDELKGKDEEGQTIDVNKVSSALRTAGIDLNKYFLGEVGLDDIFMELASKWDSLTSVQQRYIATQAAGSRQQSRFIALMQDYARTQQLVSAAYNANGASAKQFEKTQESLQSKLARLKNAWDEFLMGLANNSIIKGVVDILTTLLNIVNKLTSAFGTGAGFVLKWVTAFSAFAGVKSLFKTGGFLDLAIMGGLQAGGKGALANAAVKTGLLSGLVRGGGIASILGEEAGKIAEENAGAIAQRQASRTPFLGTGGLFSNLGTKIREFKLNNQRQYFDEKGWQNWLNTDEAALMGGGLDAKGDFNKLATPKTLFGALGNKFIGTKVGSGMQGALSKLPGIGSAFTGAAAGAATLGVALAGVAAAAGLVYAAWRASPQGQLKTAQKQAEKAREEAEEAQKELNTLTSLQDTYKEKTEAIDNATTVQDRKQAIEDRNQALLNAIKEDGTLAQYVITEQVDNEIVLKVDEAGLAEAAEKATKIAEEAAIKSYFKEGTVGVKEASVAKNSLEEILTGTGLFDASNVAEKSVEEIYQLILQYSGSLSQEQLSKAAEYYGSYNASIGSAEQQTRLAYGKSLALAGASDELTNALIPVLSKIGINTGKQFSTTQLENLIASSGALSIASTINGKGKLPEITLSDDIINDRGKLLESLGISEDALKGFATALGVSTKDIYAQIKASAKQQKEIQKQNQATIFQSALSSGIKINKDVFTDVKTMEPQIAAQVAEISNAAQKAMSKEGFKSLMEQMISGSLNTNQLQEIQSFYNNFNLDNPIQAFHQLKQAQDEVASRADTDPFKGMLASIDEANKKIFDTGNLVQTFITSANYDSLTDSLENFIKENGRITSNNIEELADSCSDLQILLEDTTITAQGLAEAFTQFENGSLAIDSITSSLLSALSAGESFEGLIDNVSKWIKDFNEGTDLKTGTEHIVSSLDDLYKYVDNWEFGNEPTENIFNHIFGDKAYETKLKQFVNDTKTDFVGLENSLKGDIERIKGWAENEGLGGIQQALSKGVTGLSQIEGEGGLFFDWNLSQFDTTAQAINEVSKALNVGKDTAEAFIMSWQTHIPYLRTEWNNLNFKEAINAFVTDLGNSRTITEQELDALSAKYGKEVDEIINEINRLRTAAGEDIIVRVNWKDEKGQNLTGDALINQFNKAAEQAGDIQSTTKYNGRDLETKYDYSKIGEEFSKTFDNVVGPNGILQNGIDAIDFSALSEHLVDAYKLSPQQANEVADNIIKSTDGKFAQTIKVPIEAEDGSIEMMEKTVIADSAEGLSAAVNAELEAADMTILAGKLANLDVESVGSRLSDALITAGSTGAASIQSDLNGIKVNTIQVPVDWYWVNSPPSGGSGNTNPVTGGIVGSYAGGSEHFHVNPGTSLTGEEGPEIVWNKDGKYAYITGQNGPEFADLHPGDRVFNAAETRRILRNSNASGGLVDSYASGGWKPPASSSKSGGGSSGGSGKGSSGKDKTPEEWKNDLDWLYNLMEDIAELERDQKAIEEQYEDLLQDQTKTGGDLYRLLVKQLGNLYTQLNHQTFALEKREQEMREFMDITNDQDQYLWYNWQDRTLEIDWDAIDQITDEEQYKHVKELIDEAEEIQDKIDDADDSIMDITNQIQELENIWRDTFVDFEDRVLDAIIKSYQQIIDNYSELNDTLNNSNTQILDSLQKQISLERQIRDNTKTEEEISDEEARLAYLRRDTSGGNELAALQLERELADQRESYEDTLVDQAISRLQEDNDAAAQQRERQIEIMQAQLDYQSENGEFNAYISELLTAAMGADGELLTNSDLVTLLKEQENWDAMSAVSKQVWDEELNGTFKEVAAFLLKQNAEENGTYYTALTAAVESVSSAIGSYSQAMVKLGNTISSIGSSGGYSGGGSSGGGSGSSSSGSSDKTYKPAQTYTIGGNIHHTRAVQIGTGSVTLPIKKHAKGGLNTQTGLAWLDGTPSEPEYVLNARQTDAFLKLADVLPSMMNGISTNTSNTFGSTYLNVSVNLESVSPDYDVDRMVDLVKDKLYDAGSYRNINSLSFLR